MRLLLSSPTLGHRLESNHIGSKLPTDSNESKERQKQNWPNDSNESKELHQLIERQAADKLPEPEPKSKYSES